MPKRLIVCADGTWNTPDQKTDGRYHPTNVVKIARSIVPTAPDGTAQAVFYDQGVGTGGFWDRFVGGAFGVGLKENIQDGYRFLIHNYEQGDQIFLFGFSRGAFTVRSLAGLIRNCGVLKKQHADRFEEAFDLYRSQDIKPDDPKADAFIAAYCHRVSIYFIGVWDTVGSLGIPMGLFRQFNRKRFQFHDVKLSSTINNAFHALAVDEKRRSFKPTLWMTKKNVDQRVEQYWFPGVHSDVGGGYPESELSDTTFMWMRQMAMECGLAFDDDYVKTTIKPNPEGVLHNSRTGLFRLLPKYLRKIGQEHDAGEQVHHSVLERFENVETYKPKNFALFQENAV